MEAFVIGLGYVTTHLFGCGRSLRGATDVVGVVFSSLAERSFLRNKTNHLKERRRTNKCETWKHFVSGASALPPSPPTHHRSDHVTRGGATCHASSFRYFHWQTHRCHLWRLAIQVEANGNDIKNRSFMGNRFLEKVTCRNSGRWWIASLPIVALPDGFYMVTISQLFHSVP